MPTQSQAPRRRFSRARLVATCAALLLLHAAAAAAQQDSHVRVADRGLKAMLETGATQSPALRALLADLEAAPILVFIDCGVQMRTRVGARLNFVTSVDGVRYVRVGVDCSLGARHQLALLAHELQHALEIAGRPDVVDVDSMASYYEDVGYFTYKNRTAKGFETAAAIAMQQRVDDEISGRSRPKRAANRIP
jgi:hypothetical protein